MRSAIFVGILIVVVLFGEWGYRTFFRPIDPLQPEILALAEHFNANGIKVRPYAVRNGFPHSEVLATAAFEIEGFPLPIAVDLCPDERQAEGQFRNIQVSPNLMHPRQNGRLVMNLPMWGEGTDEMAKKVENAFSSFHAT